MLVFLKKNKRVYISDKFIGHKVKRLEDQMAGAIATEEIEQN